MEVVVFLITFDNFELSKQQSQSTKFYRPRLKVKSFWPASLSRLLFCRLHVDVNQTRISAHTIDSTYRDPLPPTDIPHLVVDGTPPDKSTLCTWLCRLHLKPKMAYVNCHEHVFTLSEMWCSDAVNVNGTRSVCCIYVHVLCNARHSQLEQGGHWH